MQIRITKPTSMPGEVTTVSSIGPMVNQAVGDLRLVIGRITKAVDWRVRTENDRKLETTRRNLRKYGVRVKGF